MGSSNVLNSGSPKVDFVSYLLSSHPQHAEDRQRMWHRHTSVENAIPMSNIERNRVRQKCIYKNLRIPWVSNDRHQDTMTFDRSQRMILASSFVSPSIVAIFAAYSIRLMGARRCIVDDPANDALQAYQGRIRVVQHVPPNDTSSTRPTYSVRHVCDIATRTNFSARRTAFATHYWRCVKPWRRSI